MRKLCLIVCTVLALAAAPYSFAQQRTLPTQFGNWSGRFNPDDAHALELPNMANLAKEAGLSGTEWMDYSSGTSKIHVDLEKYKDPSSAYEIYTALIRPDMHPSILEQTSAVDGDKLVVLLGNSILKLRPTPAISTADLRTLLKAVSARSDKTPLPPVRTYLPTGFSDGTQRYALGPVALRNALSSLGREEFESLVGEAGFSSGVEAMFAEYRKGRESAALLLLEYPTPQLAEQHLRHLELAVSPAAKEAGTTMERKGSLLSLVLRPSSPGFGEALRSTLNYETQVTWNEPRQTISDPPMLSTVGKIIISTILLMVVAMVLGVAFGGVRVLAKTFFPGRFFDRPEQMDVLQLGLSGKRIDSRDFY